MHYFHIFLWAIQKWALNILSSGKIRLSLGSIHTELRRKISSAKHRFNAGINTWHHLQNSTWNPCGRDTSEAKLRGKASLTPLYISKPSFILSPLRLWTLYFFFLTFLKITETETHTCTHICLHTITNRAWQSSELCLVSERHSVRNRQREPSSGNSM